jgi:hypothetical protein
MALLASKTFLAQRQLSGLIIIGHEPFALTPCLEIIFPLLSLPPPATPYIFHNRINQYPLLKSNRAHSTYTISAPSISVAVI